MHQVDDPPGEPAHVIRRVEALLLDGSDGTSLALGHGGILAPLDRAKFGGQTTLASQSGLHCRVTQVVSNFW